MNEQLKELLGEELFNQVSPKLDGKGLMLVTKSRFDEQGQKIKALQEIDAKKDLEIAELLKKSSGTEELSKKLTESQEQWKNEKLQMESKFNLDKKKFAVKDFLRSEGVEDDEAMELLMTKFDLNKVELDKDDKPINVESTIKPLKENKLFSGFFGQKQFIGQEHKKGIDPLLGEFAGDKNPFSKKGWNLSKQIELNRSNPELAKKLIDSAH
jgi:hypothetical protein